MYPNVQSFGMLGDTCTESIFSKMEVSMIIDTLSKSTVI